MTGASTGTGLLQAQADRVEAAFREATGAEPAGVWTAPGRVNVIGEHTDYNDGFVLPVAIDRQVVVAARRRDDGRLVARSLQDPAIVDVPVDGARPDRIEGWGVYPAGVAWALGREARVGGVDLVVDGSVPKGSGLSSSAALECGTAVALADLYGLDADPTRLALAAQRAENEIAGAPTGIMDQMASMHGLAGHALFLDTRTREVEQVPFLLAAAGLALVVVNTNAPHRNADGAYAERRRSCEEAARRLGVPALRDVTPDELEAGRAGLDDLLYRRARHVVEEDARVLAAVELLRAGRVSALGPLLAASHASLRDDFEVSSPELDVAVEAALAAGAVGARMTGAGFGGSALALVPEERVSTLLEAVPAAFAEHGLRPPDPFVVAVCDGARRLR